MMRLKRIVVLLTLCASAAVTPVQAQPQSQSQQTQVQDGIEVRPMYRFRTLISEEDLENQAQTQYLGLLQQAQQKGALVPSSDPQVTRLRAIARRIIPETTRWNPDAAHWKWQVNLINSPEVNAFCMPGGRIAFYTGILTQLKLTDDEVAAVMGHEIAHALREHGREQAVKGLGTSVLSRLAGAGLSAWLGVDPRITNTGANVVAQLVVLRFSRDDEREADLVGLDVAARAGFDPRAGVALWNKMAALNKRAPIALLSTHPRGADRIADIEKHMNVLLPVYARAKGVNPAQLPPYRTVALAGN